MHPNCRCSTSAYEDSEEYEAWLDFLEQGGTTEEWNASGRAAWEKKVAKASAHDIIQEANRRITQPTKESVEAVPCCAFHEFTEQENAKTQRHFQNLLLEVMKHPAKTEVSAVYDINLNQIGDWSVGGQLHCQIQELDTMFYSVHNHPSGECFSFADVQNFFRRPYEIGMFVVGNNGAVYGLQKTIDSDIDGFSKAIEQAQKKLEAYSGDSVDEVIEIIETPLKEAEQYGFVYTKAPPTHR